MLQRKSSVAFLGGALDACCLWRTYMPHVATPGSSFYLFLDKPKFELFVSQDAVVVQRCCLQQQLEFIKTCSALGLKVVYDLDDNIWNVPKYNPAYHILETVKEGFTSCIKMADVVTVSTKVLEKEVRRHVKEMINVRGKAIPIVICENKIVDGTFAAPVLPREQVIVGWQGSSSHLGDLDLIHSAVAAVSKENPDTVFQFRGCDIPDYNPLRKASNYEWRLWLPVAEYAMRMPTWGWSIALAPVSEHPFNDSKSAIKMVEAGYCSTPCLASHMRPYWEFCSHHKDLEWLLCTVSSQWTSKLRELVNDKARREYLGTLCKQVVTEHYTWTEEKGHEGWDKVYQLVSTM